MKTIINHPITVFVGILGSLITILVFLTGRPDLRHFFSIQENNHEIDSSEFAKRSTNYGIKITLPDTTEGKSIKIDSVTYKAGEIIDGKYVNLYLNLRMDIPDNYSISIGEINNSKHTNTLIELRTNIGDVMLFKIELEDIETTVASQKIFIRGFFSRMVSNFKIKDHKSTSIDDDYSYACIGGKDFYYIKQEVEYSQDLFVKQRVYIGYIKNRLVTILLNNYTEDQLVDCLNMLKTIHIFN